MLIIIIIIIYSFFAKERPIMQGQQTNALSSLLTMYSTVSPVTQAE